MKRWEMLLAGLLFIRPALAEDPALQAAFEQRYRDYLGAGSQALLPFPNVDKSVWKKLRETRPLTPVFVLPDRYYNAKIYTLTLYQATDDGSYYLEAVGGFWGMDTLAYGPIDVEVLR